MESKNLDFEQKKILSVAYTIIREKRGNKKSFLIRSKEVRKIFKIVFPSRDSIVRFIDSIFSNPNKLKWAWKITGFSFIGLNDIYKAFIGSDHPVFVELFGYSFIAGTFIKEKKEKMGEVGNFSAENVQYIKLNTSSCAVQA
jgi:hypothetical protein